MDLFPYPRWSQGLPGRFAWATASIGIIGLLLLSLIVWVEHFDAGAPEVETAPPVLEAAPREAEPMHTGSGLGSAKPGVRNQPRVHRDARRRSHPRHSRCRGNLERQQTGRATRNPAPRAQPAFPSSHPAG